MVREKYNNNLSKKTIRSNWSLGVNAINTLANKILIKGYSLNDEDNLRNSGG